MVTTSIKKIGQINYVSLWIVVFWLVFYMFKNQIAADTGDGIQHYFIAQGSWFQPELFLNHWGKPLFILLSSPFAQFGFKGMVFFNILIFFLSILTAFRIFDKLKVNIQIQALFPIVLLLAKDISINIFGGLTETLFNFFILLCLNALLNKNYSVLSIIASFTPFLRSEGQLIVVLVFILLIYHKQYKYIPLVFFGFIIYSIAGIGVYHDFWWYFTKSPYQMNNDIYGKGNWYDYLMNFKEYIGWLGLIFTVLGSIQLIHLIKNKVWNIIQLDAAFFVYGIYGGILVLHSYFWATGQNGSLGLTRIATQGMPAFILFQFYYFSQASFNHKKFSQKIFTSLLVLFFIFRISNPNYPLTPNALEKQIINTADFVKSIKQKDTKVYYHFQLLAEQLGQNPYKPNQYCKHFSANNLKQEVYNNFKVGDLLIRDSHFGPQEANIQLHDLAKIPELVKIKEFISTEQTADRYNEVEGAVVYQFIPKHLQHQLKTEKINLIKHKTIAIKQGKEFLDILPLVPQVKTDGIVNFQLFTTNNNLNLVFDYNNTEDYSDMPLKAGVMLNATFKIKEIHKSKLYVWNRSKKKAQFTISNFTVEYKQMHPIVFPK